MMVLTMRLAAALAMTLTFAAHPLAPVSRAQEENVDPGRFTAVVTNPLFPASLVTHREFAGEERDPESGDATELRVVEDLLAATTTIDGIESLIIEVKEWENGELVEMTRDYYAQEDDGSVYYLGEAVDNYEEGVVTGHEGSWRAGEGENQPGVFMPGHPEVGQEFSQERAPGVAEDTSTVVLVDLRVSVPAGEFENCIRTEDVNPLDGTTEYKEYCPGVGLVREESATSNLELVSFDTVEDDASALASGAG